MSKRKVAYYYDADTGAYTYGIGHPMKPHRVRMTHELVNVYGMLPKMQVLKPKRASSESMTAFHTDEYVHFLTRVTPETSAELTYSGTRCKYSVTFDFLVVLTLEITVLVGDDNPAFEGVFEFCSISAGGSIGAAERITSGAADIAINWAGGLHHAKKREASGFCYINDIVLGILELLRSYSRVLYIDIDCHHGDGVEEAFYTTDRVMTCSFHKFGEYFPGTGTQEDKGRGKGKGYAVNVPFKDGLTDQAFKSVFEPVISRILEIFQPSAVVLQCGADSLSGDKLGCFNVSMEGHAHCVQFLRKSNIPLILLGGGGYTIKNVARAWTYETACALGIEDEIDRHLPWNQYFEWFGPRYRLEVADSNMDDLNVKDGSIDKVRTTALEQLQELASACAPSVQLQDVPKESIGQHLGFKTDEEEPRDELDERLAQHAKYVFDLPDSDTSETDDDDSWDSDESHASRRRQTRRYPPPPRTRMSLLTGKYFDVPVHDDGYEHYECGALPSKTSRRRFFQSSAKWDESLDQVILKKTGGLRTPLGELMERAGLDDDEGWDEMAVDS